MGKKGTWATTCLRLAAAYNVILGLWMVLYPESDVRLLGLTAPGATHEVRLAGAFLAVLGMGFAVASRDPLRNWVTVLNGALGKLVIPFILLGFARAGEVSWASFALVSVIELAWIIPLGMIIHQAEQAEYSKRLVSSPEIVRMALRAKTQHGITLHEMSIMGPTLVVFLRQLGCPFCREMLSDLAKSRQRIEQNGTAIVVVHMGDERSADRVFEPFGLADLPRVADSSQALYRAFGLPVGKTKQVLGFRAWLRVVPLLLKHGVGRTEGDGFQMPGLFLLFHGEVLRAFRHQSIADRPDYVALANEQDYPIAS